ncbi:protransforming growth factor alpha [Eucyclogobius newberryi]|uniref:protransforming growth factor alpha n=1 Tax=Eucyclogobius newberryi TaxID=166745 RepID=UPI003B58E97C
MMMAKIFWDTILLISGTFSISLVLNGSLFTFGAGRNNSTLNVANIFSESNSTAFPYFSTNGSFPTNQTSTIATSTTGTPPIKKMVVAAVMRSHFDDCPDSHRHFCFHGTCRFLIVEETPACVCHQGFVGIRCEHADLLAVVATNQSQNTIATVLVFCVIGCIFIAVLVTLLHCWWRQLCRRRRNAHHYASEKNSSGVSYWPSDSGMESYHMILLF